MIKDEYRGTDEYSDEDGNMSGNHGKSITCVMCSNVFLLQEGEQDFFVQRGLDLPKRCPSCRAERKLQSAKEGTRPDTERPDTGIRPPPQRRPLTSEVECHHCLRVTVVPFLPREGSDVYCRICWEGIKNVGTTGAVYV